MNNTLITILLLLLLVYMIIRQFTEQQVNPRNLLLFPALAIYSAYTELPDIFAHFSLLPLCAALLIGALLGVGTGILRGRYMRLRRDDLTGLIYAKPQLVSSLIWVALLILHIGTAVLAYTHFGHTLIVGLVTTLSVGLFLLNISVQKLMVYLEANHLRNGYSLQWNSRHA